MKLRSIMAMVVIMGLLATPSYAFSVKAPFAKTGHALKVVGHKAKQVGEVALVGGLFILIVMARASN